MLPVEEVIGSPAYGGGAVKKNIVSTTGEAFRAYLSAEGRAKERDEYTLK